MRVAGTVIWATDLVENSSTSGGKGKPKTTTYNYSANFAVAVSSTPILELGRIWADGNLLRGSAGDLKVEGKLRVYPGKGDEAVDPLIAADKGEIAPAFRDCAYVVFENLQLADFGNRIPALTFEIFADAQPEVFLSKVVPGIAEPHGRGSLPHTLGFADEGGALGATLSALERIFPLICRTSADGLELFLVEGKSSEVTTLPERIVAQEAGGADQRYKTRADTIDREPLALRYYDKGRDYQPGVQRTIGRRPSGLETLVDLPATLSAEGAKALANGNANRARWHHERMSWRIAELDPSIGLGSLVRAPGYPGTWMIDSWEWDDEGIELGLERVVSSDISMAGSDGGTAIPPIDAAVGQTRLHVFELPPSNVAQALRLGIFAAASSTSANWNGAALYREQGSAMHNFGSVGRERCVLGTLAEPLLAASPLTFQPDAKIAVNVIADDLGFEGTDISGLAAGANRLLIGGEIVQFLSAVRQGAAQWELSGLLRGRAGTEERSLHEHAAGSRVILLDDKLTDLPDAGLIADPDLRIGAIGRGDEEAVFAELTNPGLSRRPLCPIHPRLISHADGSIELCWTRRARGQWQWDYGEDVPLVEQIEKYLVGYGSLANPGLVFSTGQARIAFSATQRDAIVSEHGPADLWVRQIGTYSHSEALWLTRFN
jgi:hypothetical protein